MIALVSRNAERLGCKNDPILPMIPIHRYVVPPLHLLLGIVNRLIKGLIENVVDKMSENVPDNVHMARDAQLAAAIEYSKVLATSNNADDPLVVEAKGKLATANAIVNKEESKKRPEGNPVRNGLEDQCFHPFHVNKEAYHAGDYNGNDCRTVMAESSAIFRCMKDYILPLINDTMRLPKSVAPTTDNIEKIKTLATTWLNRTLTCLNLFDSVFSLMRKVDRQDGDRDKDERSNQQSDDVLARDWISHSTQSTSHQRPSP